MDFINVIVFELINCTKVKIKKANYERILFKIKNSTKYRRVFIVNWPNLIWQYLSVT